MAGIQKEDTEDQTQSETVKESEDASSVESSESESASDEAAASEEASNKETLTQTENEETESESAENNHKKGLCMYMRSLFAFHANVNR